MTKQRAPKVFIDEPVEPEAYRRTLIGFTARECARAGSPGIPESLEVPQEEGLAPEAPGPAEDGA